MKSAILLEAGDIQFSRVVVVGKRFLRSPSEPRIPGSVVQSSVNLTPTTPPQMW
jgi:hypothetical protein